MLEAELQDVNNSEKKKVRIVSLYLAILFFLRIAIKKSLNCEINSRSSLFYFSFWGGK